MLEEGRKSAYILTGKKIVKFVVMACLMLILSMGLFSCSSAAAAINNNPAQTEALAPSQTNNENTTNSGSSSNSSNEANSLPETNPPQTSTNNSTTNSSTTNGDFSDEGESNASASDIIYVEKIQVSFDYYVFNYSDFETGLNYWTKRSTLSNGKPITGTLTCIRPNLSKPTDYNYGKAFTNMGEVYTYAMIAVDFKVEDNDGIDASVSAAHHAQYGGDIFYVIDDSWVVGNNISNQYINRLDTAKRYVVLKRNNNKITLASETGNYVYHSSAYDLTKDAASGVKEISFTTPIANGVSWSPTYNYTNSGKCSLSVIHNNSAIYQQAGVYASKTVWLTESSYNLTIDIDSIDKTFYSYSLKAVNLSFNGNSYTGVNVGTLGNLAWAPYGGENFYIKKADVGALNYGETYHYIAPMGNHVTLDLKLAPDAGLNVAIGRCNELSIKDTSMDTLNIQAINSEDQATTKINLEGVDASSVIIYPDFVNEVYVDAGSNDSIPISLCQSSANNSYGTGPKIEKVTIASGVYSTISYNGTTYDKIVNRAGSVLNISGGTFNCPIENYGTLNISGGTFNEFVTNYGELNTTGGEFVKYLKCLESGTTTIDGGYCTGIYNEGILTINSGTIANNYNIIATEYYGDGFEGSLFSCDNTVSITGGTLHGRVEFYSVTNTISGGTFNDVVLNRRKLTITGSPVFYKDLLNMNNSAFTHIKTTTTYEFPRIYTNSTYSSGGGAGLYIESGSVDLLDIETVLSKVQIDKAIVNTINVKNGTTIYLCGNNSNIINADIETINIKKGTCNLDVRKHADVNKIHVFNNAKLNILNGVSGDNGFLEIHHIYLKYLVSVPTNVPIDISTYYCMVDDIDITEANAGETSLYVAKDYDANSVLPSDKNYNVTNSVVGVTAKKELINSKYYISVIAVAEGTIIIDDADGVHSAEDFDFWALNNETITGASLVIEQVSFDKITSIHLTSDIHVTRYRPNASGVFTSETWNGITSLGNGSETITFNGNGHTIFFENASMGLAQMLGSKVIVQNLCIAGNITGADGAPVGAIAGEIIGKVEGDLHPKTTTVNIKNCYFRGNIIATNARAAGIVGSVSKIDGIDCGVNILNCISNGVISCTNGNVAGICNSTSDYAAMYNCINYSLIKLQMESGLSSNLFAAGICASTGEYSWAKKLYNCYNFGNINVVNNTTNTATISTISTVIDKVSNNGFSYTSTYKTYYTGNQTNKSNCIITYTDGNGAKRYMQANKVYGDLDNENNYIAMSVYNYNAKTTQNMLKRNIANIIAGNYKNSEGNDILTFNSSYAWDTLVWESML